MSGKAKKSKKVAGLVSADLYHGFQCNGASIHVEPITPDTMGRKPVARVSILTREASLVLLLNPAATRRLSEALRKAVPRG